MPRRRLKSRRRGPTRSRASPPYGGVLSDKGIKAALQRREITIIPTPGDEQYTTSAVDLYLDGEFRQWDLTPNKTAICQLIFERLESPPAGEIRTQFQDQATPTGRKPRS